MFVFATQRPRRRPSLTPMIDVVFLLLVFFMLASRFGTDMHLPLNVAGTGGGEAYQGPPRLVDIRPDGLSLNGETVALEDLPARLESLTDDQGDTIVLRTRDDAALQEVVRVMEALGTAGFTGLTLVE
ncbi:biopolymer transport protein ExbD [Tranquillimonas rosea]|uniref:Biopolymer transport protein ExbD n=1 Tax=Tranquillimonas rosea TaxID=641238 RepID=A0A1H9WWU6_9RHOB|nr:biopolymer transporter ExbD [Tranquillimonas rosea]SES38289.1 biopolymer transport protein ExbD [Tranquillimonas rosea]